MHLQFFQNTRGKLTLICHCSHGNFEIMLIILSISIYCTRGLELAMLVKVMQILSKTSVLAEFFKYSLSCNTSHDRKHP